MNKLKILLVLLLLHPLISAGEIAITKHRNILPIIDRLVKKHDFDRAEINRVFDQAEYQPKIITLIRKPAEKLDWHRYRRFFIYPENIQRGIEFMRQNHAVLEKAEKEYGVPSEVIAAIIGVETRFGKNAGSHLLIDSLSTLVIGYPRRSSFFAEQLENMFVVARDHNLDVLNLKGSYAGAIGIPQFIPTSYLSYAVDFDNDGVINLIDSLPDAIGSVANYLKAHKWRRDEPTVSRVVGPKMSHYVNKTLKIDNSSDALKAKGIRIVPTPKKDMPVSILRLKEKEGNTYVAAHHNFFVITTYNRSQIYAMAVTDLARQMRLGFD